MIRRFAVTVSLCLLIVLTSSWAISAATEPTGAQELPVAASDAGQSVFGTIRTPEGKPLKGARVTVSRNGATVGSVTTDAKGTWKVPVPTAGTYVVTLDVGSLPASVQVRRQGGQRLDHVDVRTGESQPVLFALAAGGAKQEPATTATSAATSSAPATTGSTAGTAGQSGGGAGARLVQLFVGGIEYGAIIAITAVGLSLVFGTTRLINFAHGEMVMIGAVVAYIVSSGLLHLPLVIAAVVAMAAVGVLGAGFEYTLWRPLRRRHAGLIQMFIISIGLSLLLRHLVLAFFGGRRRQYDQYAVQDSIHLGPVSITPRDLIITAASLLILLGVAMALQRTRIGKATRAVADNKDLAEASGIDVNRVIMVIWVAGGALAGLGGVFFGLSEAVYWDMGFNLLLLMFAGIIVGGLGSAYGAMIGSLLVGLVAQLSTMWFSPELQNAWALFALIIVLLVRPQGILGRAQRAG